MAEAPGAQRSPRLPGFMPALQPGLPVAIAGARPCGGGDLEGQVGEVPKGAERTEEDAAPPVEDVAGVLRRSLRRTGHRVFRSSYMS